MPANKDEKRGTWIAQFYYTDWTGARKKKKKRGFATKREALEWERDFLQMQTASVNMSLSAFPICTWRICLTGSENPRW